MDNELERKDTIDYLYFIIDKCYNKVEYWQKEETKLLYLSLSVFFIIAGLTGFVKTKSFNTAFINNYGWYQLIILHIIFSIFWLMFCYKRINQDLFKKFADAAEKKLRGLIDINENSFSTLARLKRNYFGKYSIRDIKSIKARKLCIIPFILLILLFGFVVNFPFINFENPDNITFDYKLVVSVLLFFALYLIPLHYSQKYKQDMKKKIDNDWNNFEFKK